METAPRLYHVVNSSADGDTGVNAYFETLRREQTRFLEAVERARSLLGSDSGQLAQVTATQGMLTRQFLDAQRSIMKRRAQVDAEVGGIVKEAASLSTVLVGAFEADHPAYTNAQQQLATLLDDWWHAENVRGRTVLDAAQAATRHNGQENEAATSQAALPPPKPDDECADLAPPVRLAPSVPLAPPSLPAPLVITLDDAKATDLVSLCAGIADSPQSSGATRPDLRIAPADDLVIRLDLPTSVASTRGASEETFGEFWGERRHPRPTGTGTTKWVAAHILLPVTVLTSALCVVMTLIG
jgi:hypothetical protein